MPYKGLSPVYGSENAVSDYTKTLTDNDSYIHSVQHAKDIHLASLPPQEAPDVSFNIDNFGNVGSLVMDDTSDIPTMDGSENNDRYLGDSPNLKLTDENEGVLMNLFNALPEEGQRLATPIIAPFFNNPVVSGMTLGITDAGQGILDIARDFNNFIVEGNGGEGVSEDDWAKIPEILASNPDSTTEGVVRGLTQFMSIFAGLGGMQSVVKVGSKTKQFFNQMLAAGVADASFDPELGNISTLINELDFIDEDNPIGAVTEFLGAPVGEDADAAERLAFRAKSVLEGAGLAVGVQGLMEAFKFLKKTMMETDPDKFIKILAKAGIPDPRSFIVDNSGVSINAANVTPLKAADFKRNKDGTYVGFNKTINTPQKMTKLIKQLEAFAKEGEKGKMWYENSSTAILKMAGNDPKEAEILAQLIAVTSQSTGVKTNTGFALKAYSQWKAGLPIDTGRFPKAQSEKITNILNGVPWEGRKTNSFYRNLMVNIDPKVAADLPTTQDMWMARAFNLDSDSPTAAQYENMERVTQNIATRFGWNPHQVQAAVWVAVKGRFDPVKSSIAKHAKEKGWINSAGEVLPKYQKKYDKYFNEKVFEAEFDESQMLKAAYDYSNGLEDNLGNIALEAIPSRTSNVLSGIHNASPQEQASFTKDMYDIFLDEDGIDGLAKEIGILSPDNFTGFGGWMGDVNTSVQLRAVMSGTADGGINPADQELMDIYASVVGTVFKQDGVSYRRAFSAKNMKESNGVLVELTDARGLTQEETEKLYRALEAEFGDSWTSPIPSKNGVELINYSDDIDNKTFKQKVKNAIIAADLPDSTIASFKSDGKLLENDWSKNKNGQGYEQGLSERSSSIYRGLVSKYDQKAEEVRQGYAKEYGWDEGSKGSTSSSTVVPAAFYYAEPEQQTTGDFIKSFEGYQDKGYYATESEQEAGLVTAGYGSTNRVDQGEQITEAQAEEFFQEDLAVAETAVDKLVTTELSSNQRAAIVSLVFNVGQGNFKKSKALKALNKGDIDTFLKEAFDPKIGFVKSGGKVLNGLVTRRQAEKQLFLGGTA